MDHTPAYPTLLPYLLPAHPGFRLSVSRMNDDRPDEEQPRSPFAVVSESGPFTRIIAAQVKSGGSRPVKQLFLLVSKDAYSMSTGGIVPMTNLLVEESWQRVFRKKGDSLITLQGQVGEDGSLIPFSSLFYCRATETFFHPPCPFCGNDLILCRDDAVLKENGLKAYSSSLNRYLYCPSCLSQKGSTDFYASAPAGTEPAKVKGRHALVKDFGMLMGKDAPPESFPCTTCPTRRECYESKGLAGQRIVPFSFYPFFLLVLEPGTVNAFDFLALLSGAAGSELKTRLNGNNETGRLLSVKALAPSLSTGQHLFFTQDERRFLEILYLKCAFLAQLSKIVLTGTNACRYPDLAGSADRLWVSLQQQQSGLPFFWNFSLEIIEMGETALPAMPPSYGTYMLGLLWFQVLAANNLQGASDISKALSERINSLLASPEQGSAGFARINGEHIFDPADIFWNPDRSTVREEWAALWQKALDLGWSLLANGMKPDSAFSAPAFLEDIDFLRDTVKQELFSHAPGAGESTAKSPEKAISSILEDIIVSYETMQEKAPGDTGHDTAAPPEQPAPVITKVRAMPEEGRAATGEGRAGEDGGETMIISPSPPEQFRVEVPLDQDGEKTVVMHAPPEECAESVTKDTGLEDSHETIVLTADHVRTLMGDMKAGQSPKSVILTQAKKPEEIAETVIMGSSPGKQEESPEETVIMKTGHGTVEDVPETVIMGSAPAANDKPLTRETEKGRTRPEPEDDIPETVIMSPISGAGKKIPGAGTGMPDMKKEEKKSEPFKEDDSLAETIIINPDKGKK